MTRLTRRKLLQLLAVGGAAAALPSSFPPDLARRRPPDAAARLGRLYAHTESAAVIGRRYLEIAPHEADVTRLATRIVDASRALGDAYDHANPDALRAMLARMQREDFRQARVVSVDGWVLSLTEVRLCAITALTHAA